MTAFKTRVLNYGTPTRCFQLVIQSDDGEEKIVDDSTNTADLLKCFDDACKEAQKLVANDGVNRTVLIRQTILQKNVWVT
ncbi:hypothetical protein [Nitrospira sp. BLG_2]|uniref:hypothetical protein n=1 Tax=Nitrospira sp. BLG_2 TaxID=3397507 RepID=UPI003B9D0677